MKASVFIAIFCLSVSANAAETEVAPCAAASQAVAAKMYIGTSKAENRNINVNVANGFDDNSDLVYAVDIAEVVQNGKMTEFSGASYKVVASGSAERCEIISVRKMSK